MLSIEYLKSLQSLIREGLVGNGSSDLYNITCLISEMSSDKSSHYVVEALSNEVRLMIEGVDNRSVLVLEGEDDPFAAEDDEGGDEAEDEGGDEGGDDPFAGDEEGEDEEGGDEEGGDEEGGDKKEDESQPTGPIDTVFDSAISDLYTEFEGKAMQLASQEKATYESRNYSLKQILVEEEELFDVRVFAREVANLINNYEHLLDVEYLLYKKAVEFLEKKYGKLVMNSFIDTLKSEYSLSFTDEPEEVATPDAQEKFAIGAVSGE